MFTLEPMEPLNKSLYTKDKNGKLNPMNVDSYSMGRPVSEDIMMMVDFHTDQPFENCYFVNTKTGERQRLIYSKTKRDIIMIAGVEYELHSTNTQNTCGRCHFEIVAPGNPKCPTKPNSKELLCIAKDQGGYFIKL